MKNKYRSLALIVSLFIPFFLFIDLNYKIPIDLLKSLKNKVLTTSAQFKNIKLSCTIPALKILPENAMVVIGHAYGSHIASYRREIDNKGFLAPKISKFLDQNRRKIETVIFTGDVFSIPSISKWNQLSNSYKNDFDIIISPGNHDIGNTPNNAKKDIFSIYVYNLDNYPFTYSSQGFHMVIDNSVENMYMNDKRIYYLLSSNANDESLKNILFRHYIPVSELAYLSNENIGLSKLPSVKDLDKKIKNTIIISGDGGAFKYLPRISCIKFNSNKYIVNGIGELADDKILVIHNNDIYQMAI